MKPQKPHNNIGKRVYKQITKLPNDHINLNLGHGAKFTVRVMYSLLAICLYNLWVLINLLHDFEIIKKAVATCKKYKPSITTGMARRSYERWLVAMCGGVEA